jgi:FKBP-type peptidyl-prolyl cis-trans isomerase FkpA
MNPMKTISFALLSILTTLVLMVGCKDSTTNYEKTVNGLPYKIIRSKDTQAVNPGNWIKIIVTQKLNDSLIFSSASGLPAYVFISNTDNRPYDISEIWTKLHRGDSVVVVQMMDTFIKRTPTKVPPIFKNGDRYITMVRVLDVFTDEKLAQKDEENERNNFAAKEDSAIKAYLEKNHITAQMTPSGAYVQIIRQGEGPNVDSNNYLTINYTGTTWSGKRFDSNTDTSFHHPQPYSFVAGAQQMIKGFDESMFFLKKGAIAKLYIPSMLGYGAEPRGVIKPFESLIFDVELVDVKDHGPMTPAPVIDPKKLIPLNKKLGEHSN